MKRLWAAVLLVFCVQANQNKEFFFQAQKEYASHNFEKACSLFYKINPKTAVIWYNIAACYYHLGKDLDALTSWQRAYRMGSGALVQESAYYIAQLENKLGSTQSPAIGANVMRWVRTNVQALSLLLLQVLFFCIFSVFLFVVRTLSMRRSYFSMVFCSLPVLLLAGALSIKYTEQSKRLAVVFENNTNLFVGPNSEFHAIATVNAGVCASIIQQQGSWCKIRCTDKEGWIEKKYIELV